MPLNLTNSTVSNNLCQGGAGASGTAGGIASGGGIGNDHNAIAIVSGINASGQIVGYYQDSRSHGFLFDQGGYITLDVPGTNGSTWVTGINDSGQIVGSYGGDWDLHGFLATPVP
jgi:probable HAF family extracellular repeat protein